MFGDVKFRFRVDLHVHTRRYSPCAESLDPAHLSWAMERSGLDGLVITEHDQLWPAEDIAAMNRQLENRRIYRGVEVSSKSGHFIAIGLNGMEGIEKGMEIQRLIDHIQCRGAAVIWAHPFLRYPSIPTVLDSSDMPPGLHAVEVASGVTSGRETIIARELAVRHGWSAVGGSDAHAPGQVGCAFTLFNELPADEKILAEAIRNGQCMAGPTRTKDTP